MNLKVIDAIIKTVECNKYNPPVAGLRVVVNTGRPLLLISHQAGIRLNLQACIRALCTMRLTSKIE
ncbi:MAG: hypothetical protein KAQ89_05890 [Planctomycetes bacterium]|nr:hypothetical protein [Planctomycetota bacterium]